ncbi:MAG: hypothetical protein ACM3WP_10885 [Acidobacteriota bacterium]
MRDPYTVLHEKEQDVERIRREIHALVIVIPLLIDDETPSIDVLHLLGLDSALPAAKASGDDMSALETYYPWIRHMRQSKRT